MDTTPKFELYSKVKFRGEYHTFFVVARYFEYDLKEWHYALRDSSGSGMMIHEVLLEQVVEKEAAA